RPVGGPFTLDQGKASHDRRLAFALSVDRAKLAKDVCSDVTCVPATGGVIPKGLLGYLGDNSDPLAAFDPVRARTLLLAADPNGAKSIDLTYTYDPENAFNEPVAKFLQSQWLTNLGVTVKLQAVPHTRFITERLKGLYVLSRDGWAADYNHPQDWFDNLWGSVAGCPDASCSSGYATRAYDQLLARADGEPVTAAIPPLSFISRCGSTAEQIFCAIGQRVWNRRAGGGLTGEGISPFRRIGFRAASRSGSGTGTELSSTLV